MSRTVASILPTTEHRLKCLMGLNQICQIFTNLVGELLCWIKTGRNWRLKRGKQCAGLLWKQQGVRSGFSGRINCARTWQDWSISWCDVQRQWLPKTIGQFPHNAKWHLLRIANRGTQKCCQPRQNAKIHQVTMIAGARKWFQWMSTKASRNQVREQQLCNLCLQPAAGCGNKRQRKTPQRFKTTAQLNNVQQGPD